MGTAHLSGKRLLILGGQKKLCDIVERAREMGVYTVVTDWYEDSPAKRIADASYNVSTSDIKALKKLVDSEHIDGVFTGFIDSTLPYYYQLCKETNLPCYINPKTLEYCTNKRRFRQLCKKVGLDAIPEVRLSKDITTEEIEKLDFPVLIKPVDNSGSKGITVCTDEYSLKPAYERALRFSKSKDVICEKFLCCDYIVAYYAVANGKCSLYMLMDKDTNRIGKGAVPFPSAIVSPSVYYRRYIEDIDPKMSALAKEIGMENGTFLISFFVNGHKYYAVELNARLAATREYGFIKMQTGIDILGMHINHAMTGVFSGKPLPDICAQMNSRINCMLFVFVKDGIIGKIEGLEAIEKMRGVLNVLQLRDEGSTIRADGSYGQLLLRIYLNTASEREMAELSREVCSRLRVYSDGGEPMIISCFDGDRFFSRFI